MLHLALSCALAVRLVARLPSRRAFVEQQWQQVAERDGLGKNFSAVAIREPPAVLCRADSANGRYGSHFAWPANQQALGAALFDHRSEFGCVALVCGAPQAGRIRH